MFSISSKKTSFMNIHSFINGPSSDLPLTPEHGGPILYMDIRNDTIVTCSTDHGARVYNLNSGKQIKELYTKKFGHVEWVSCAKILNNNRILTGGMDSKICYWDSGQVRCIDLTEHQGSISKIMTDSNDPNESIFISSSYDTTIRIYNTVSAQNVGVLKAVHKKPVTEFNFTNSILASIDRDGYFSIWDINRQSSVLSKQLHHGQCGNIEFYSEENNNLIVTTGINDGLLNAIDLRSGKLVCNKQIHKGAINMLKISPLNNLIFTGSADKTIKVFDVKSIMNNNLKEIAVMKSTDAVFCGDLYESSYLVTGCGDGNILGYDLNKMDCVWGYGVEKQGGVRCIQIIPEKNRIVSAGDSGQGIEVLFD